MDRGFRGKGGLWANLVDDEANAQNYKKWCVGWSERRIFVPITWYQFMEGDCDVLSVAPGGDFEH